MMSEHDLLKECGELIWQNKVDPDSELVYKQPFVLN